MFWWPNFFNYSCIVCCYDYGLTRDFSGLAETFSNFSVTLKPICQLLPKPCQYKCTECPNANRKGVLLNSLKWQMIGVAIKCTENEIQSWKIFSEELLYKNAKFIAFSQKLSYIDLFTLFFTKLTKFTWQQEMVSPV